MKVTGQKPHGLSDLTAQKAKGKGDQIARPGAQPNKEAESVSNSATQTLNRIKETIRAEPDIRAERVAELKARLQDGTLKVDSEKLAENMLNAALKEDLERP